MRLLDDLLAPFDPASIDVVAGLDAMGFVLGSAMATRLGKGFLTVRKAGKLPVEADTVEFTNYTKRTQQMQMRKPAFHPGTRVLLVDQWIETGGTMQGAIELVQRQGGVVAGIAAVCIEENERTNRLRERFLCSSAVGPGTAYTGPVQPPDLGQLCKLHPREKLSIHPQRGIAPDVLDWTGAPGLLMKPRRNTLRVRLVGSTVAIILKNGTRRMRIRLGKPPAYVNQPHYGHAGPLSRDTMPGVEIL